MRTRPWSRSDGRRCPSLVSSGRRFVSRPVLLLPVLCSCLLWPGLSLAEVAPESVREEAPRQDLDIPDAMQPGGRVRLQSSLSEDRLKGSIRTLDVDQITIVDRKGRETIVPWSTVQWLDVQVGVHHVYGTAALAGGIAGALAGYLVAHSKEPCFAPGCPDEEVGGGTQAVLLGGAFGALLGLGAEGLSKPSAPRWARIPLPYVPPLGTPPPSPPVGVRVMPRHGGLAVGLVFAF